MGLVIVDKPEFTAPVRINTRQVKGDLQVTFIAYPVDELEAMEAEATKAGAGPSALVLKVVKSIEPVDGPKGRITEVAQLLKFQGVGPQLLLRYHALLWEETSGN